MTGAIPEKIKEAKPAMVVIMAKNEGLNLDSMVFKTRFFCDVLLYFCANSLYLTIKCNIIEIVMINCKAIKLEEITVISQAKNPSAPALAITEHTQIRIGIITHLISLKIRNKTIIRIRIKALPYTSKSFFTKVTISSAIILTPPKKMRELFSYFFIMFLISWIFRCSISLILSL